MPRRIKIDGVIHTFPDDATDDEIAATLDSAPARASATDATPAAVIGGSRVALPLLQRGVEEVATNPNLVKNARAAGKVIGGITGVVKAGPLGADAGSRMGGRMAEAAAKIAQKISGPLATVAEKAAPYAQTLSTLSGAQGVLDLAHMAEPNRRDIGVLGASIGEPRSDAEKAAHPALINMLLQKLLALGQ